MNRRQKIIISVTGIFLVLLLLVGLTYAYFLTRINGNTNTKSISVKTANLALVYGDGNGVLEVGEVLSPGDTVKFKTAGGDTVDKKTFTVTNLGNAKTDYVVVIEDVNVTYTATVVVDGETQTAGATTTFQSNNFVYTLTCTSGCNGVDKETTFPINGGILVGNSIDVGEEQTYELSMTYLETGLDQSSDMNKTMTARVNIKDISTINPYSSSTNSLAYNIINNAITGATGTTLVGAPLSEVAIEISKSEVVSVKGTEIELDMSSQSSWVYGSTYDDAQPWNGGSMEGSTSTCTDTIVGKFISYPPESESWYVKSCKSSTVANVISNPVIKYKSDLSVAQDDLGTSYYYRGNVQDNYLEFNGYCWRIVRIEGDGSIKITLAATKTCSSITSSDTGTAFIGTGNYGYTDDYVTNSSGATSSSKKTIADYLNGQTNNTSSMKYKLEEWLTSSGIDTSKLKEDNWCLGNTTDPYDNNGTLLTITVNDLMYGGTKFYYDTSVRLYGKGQTANATLRCDGKNYKTHKSYIGALTADEVVFAGGKAGTSNTIYYLRENATSNCWWTLSPSFFTGSGNNAFIVSSDGRVFSDYGYVTTDYSLRPAVSLASGTVITGGNGTQTNPYVVG